MQLTLQRDTCGHVNRMQGQVKGVRFRVLFLGFKVLQTKSLLRELTFNERP